MWSSAFRLVSFFLLALIAGSCVDRLFFEVEDQDESQLVVDGLITDKPGPYRVNIFKSSSINKNLNFKTPILVKEVTIFDDAGYSEVLTEKGPGIYETAAEGIKGEVGKTYSLRIVGEDGAVYESTPQKMNPISDIDSIYHEFESVISPRGSTEYGYRIFMDTKNTGAESLYLRWRVTGTYISISYPKFRRPPNCGLPPGEPDPPPCSGFIWTGTILKNVSECTCCDCFITDHEDEPKLNDDQISTSGIYKGVEVGFVPFNQWTFAHNKYMVVVEQMSLTREAYDYWKTIRDQKEGATSLFQPAYGKIQTNLQSINSARKVVGVFYASSIKKKVIFLTGADAPFSRPEFAIFPPESNCALWDACTIVFASASITPPPDWE